MGMLMVYRSAYGENKIVTHSLEIDHFLKCPLIVIFLWRLPKPPIALLLLLLFLTLVKIIIIIIIIIKRIFFKCRAVKKNF